ncbi:MAG: AraC family transcriptional regulator [Pseudomonadota bacterium]
MSLSPVSAEQPTKPFREIVGDAFESVQELGSYAGSQFGVSRLLQRFPERVDLAPSTDHTVNISMGGCYAVERHRNGQLDRTIDRPNAVTIIPEGQSTSWRATGLVDVLHIYFCTSALKQFIEENHGASAEGLSVYDALGWDDPFLRNIAPVLFHEIQPSERRDTLLMDSFYLVLAHHFVQTYTSFGGPHPQALSSLPALSDDGALERATRFINDQLEENISFAEIASHTGIPALQLRDLFKAKFGLTPYQFVLQERISRAQDYLATTQMSLAEIAYACGFSSQSHLTNLFKQRLGVPPGTYRKTLHS